MVKSMCFFFKSYKFKTREVEYVCFPKFKSQILGTNLMWWLYKGKFEDYIEW